MKIKKKIEICECGHPKKWHIGMTTIKHCHWKNKDGNYCCDCKKYKRKETKK